jgi:hypothetical protein
MRRCPFGARRTTDNPFADQVDELRVGAPGKDGRLGQWIVDPLGDAPQLVLFPAGQQLDDTWRLIADPVE